MTDPAPLAPLDPDAPRLAASPSAVPQPAPAESVPPPVPRFPITILGVAFDSLTLAETVAAVDAMITGRRPRLLVTPNVDFLYQARRDPELRRLLFEADLSLCDGMPIVWASRWFGNPLPERVAGSDLVPLLLALAERMGYRVFLLGGASAASRKAIERIRGRFPRLILAGHYSPPFADLLDMDLEAIEGQIQSAQPDLLLVSFGTPKGEKWIRMHYRRLQIPVSISVGATLDFIAGTVARAPRWMRRCGLEWLFRLLQEPRRLTRRYLKGFWFVGGGLLRQAWLLAPARGRTARAVARLEIRSQGAATHVVVCGPLTARTLAPVAAAVAPLLENVQLGFLDLTAVDFIDSTGIGWLMRVQRLADLRSKPWILIAPSAEVRRCIRWMGLESCFVCAPDPAAAAAVAERMRGEPKRGEDLQIAAEPPGMRLCWRSEVTADNAAPLWEETVRQLEGRLCGIREVALDLEDLNYLDSAGCLLLIRLRAYCAQHGASLRLRNLQPEVRSQLALSLPRWPLPPQA